MLFSDVAERYVLFSDVAERYVLFSDVAEKKCKELRHYLHDVKFCKNNRTQSFKTFPTVELF